MNKTADGWTVDIGDTVYFVHRQWQREPRVEDATVISVGGNGKVAVVYAGWGPSYGQVTRVFVCGDLYVSKQNAEEEAKK